MKKNNAIIFSLAIVIVIALPITVRGAALHYAPTQEQLQPAPIGVAPNISHNVNFESPNPSQVIGTQPSADQPAASASADTISALGQTASTSSGQGLGAGKLWIYGFLLFVVFFLLAFIFIRRQNNEK